MKLQISFNMLDLRQALHVANEVKGYCDEFKIGSLLLMQYGIEAIQKFRSKFPEKTIISDTRILDHEQNAIAIAAKTGTDWITVLGGADRSIIHSACNNAHNLDKKVLLDLIDASSFGQMAVEAQSLGVDALLFHCIGDENAPYAFLDRWDMVKGNSNLPIIISTLTTRENIIDLIKLEPAGISIGSTITLADNPQEQALYFFNLVKQA